MEAVFGKEKRQVVAGNSAGNVRIFLADEARVLAANRFQSRVNLGATASLADDVIELGFASRSYAHAQAVVGQDLEFLDVAVSLARHDRMHAAGVVANHASQRAAAVTGGIGTVGQLVFLGGVAQVIENDSGLDSGDAALGIEF